MAEMEVKYQSVAPDPEKSCKNCKHFKPDSENESTGKCFGKEVVEEGTCNFFEAKEK